MCAFLGRDCITAGNLSPTGLPGTLVLPLNCPPRPGAVLPPPGTFCSWMPAPHLSTAASNAVLGQLLAGEWTGRPHLSSLHPHQTPESTAPTRPCKLSSQVEQELTGTPHTQTPARHGSCRHHPPKHTPRFVDRHPRGSHPEPPVPALETTGHLGDLALCSPLHVRPAPLQFGKVTVMRRWSCPYARRAPELKRSPSLPPPSPIHELRTRAGLCQPGFWAATSRPKLSHPTGHPVGCASGCGLTSSALSDVAKAPGMTGMFGWELGGDTEGEEEGSSRGAREQACPVVFAEYLEPNPPAGSLPPAQGRLHFRLPLTGGALAKCNLPIRVTVTCAGTCRPRWPPPASRPGSSRSADEPKLSSCVDPGIRSSSPRPPACGQSSWARLPASGGAQGARPARPHLLSAGHQPSREDPKQEACAALAD